MIFCGAKTLHRKKYQLIAYEAFLLNNCARNREKLSEPFIDQFAVL